MTHIRMVSRIADVVSDLKSTGTQKDESILDSSFTLLFDALTAEADSLRVRVS